MQSNQLPARSLSMNCAGGYGSIDEEFNPNFGTFGSVPSEDPEYDFSDLPFNPDESLPSIPEDFPSNRQLSIFIDVILEEITAKFDRIANELNELQQSNCLPQVLLDITKENLKTTLEIELYIGSKYDTEEICSEENSEQKTNISICSVRDLMTLLNSLKAYTKHTLLIKDIIFKIIIKFVCSAGVKYAELVPWDCIINELKIPTEVFIADFALSQLPLKYRSIIDTTTTSELVTAKVNFPEDDDAPKLIPQVDIFGSHSKNKQMKLSIIKSIKDLESEKARLKTPSKKEEEIQS